MTVSFTTAIDFYKSSGNPFPSNLTDVPRQGDFVRVLPVYDKKFQDKGLPIMLEVKRVIWGAERTECELHYSEMQVKTMNLANINMFP